MRPHQKGRPLEQTGNRPEISGKRSRIHSTTPPVDLLLPRLERVKQTGPDQWLACCPAHEDKSPSLSIKQVDDRLLIYCFASCPADDVMAAVGLTLADLYDRPLAHHKPRLSQRQRRRHNHASEALKALVHECRVVWCCAGEIYSGLDIDPDTRERLNLAMSRIKAAGEVCS